MDFIPVQTAQKCAVFFVHIAHNKIMKKTLFFLLSLSILATGVAMPEAHAQHCDVQRGDSMWRIAKRYNVLFRDVLELNKHFSNPHLIHPKDEVELPDGSTGETTNDSGTGDSDASDPRGETESAQAVEILNLVNAERSKQGLQSLTLSEKLTSIANTKAKDMADKGYFSHESPTYGSPFDMLKHFGVSYSYAGENIAAGQKTAKEVMNSWMNSSGHRANILNKNYTQLGVGYVQGGQYGTEWVQLFIKP